MSHDLTVLSGATALAEAAAERFVVAAGDAIRAHGRFVVALSGGSTPRAAFERLATAPMIARVDWAHVHVVWGDERCVPPDDAASNYRMAHDALLRHVPVPATNVHRIPGDVDPAAAAAAYEATLRELLATPSGPPRATPNRRIDLVLLGLGADGHTASLFLSSAGIDERVRWAIPSRADVVPQRRITLTVPVINAAAEVLFLVSGTAKADVLRRVLDGPRRTAELPAQAIAPANGQLRWYVDAPAAAKLAGVPAPPGSAPSDRAHGSSPP